MTVTMADEEAANKDDDLVEGEVLAVGVMKEEPCFGGSGQTEREGGLEE